MNKNLALIEQMTGGMSMSNIDDVIIATERFVEYLLRKRELFDCTRIAALNWESNKWDFMMKAETSFMATSIITEVMMPNKAAIKKLKKWPVPQNKDEPVSFSEFSKFFPEFNLDY